MASATALVEFSDTVDDELRRSAVWLALRLLLHRELHSDGLSSELVLNRDYLRPWLDTHFAQGLRTRELGGMDVSRETGEPLRVTILAGAFPNFHEQFVSAFEDVAGLDIHVEFLREQDGAFAAMGLPRKAMSGLPVKRSGRSRRRLWCGFNGATL